MKILLVDDSELMLGYLASLLGKHQVASQPLEIRTARSAAEALEACARALPDAILMDFVLEPGRTGLEVLSAILALAHAKPRVAILTQGALTMPDEKRAASLGARVLQKPIRGQEADFLAMIDEWLTA